MLQRATSASQARARFLPGATIALRATKIKTIKTT